MNHFGQIHAGRLSWTTWTLVDSVDSVHPRTRGLGSPPFRGSPSVRSKRASLPPHDGKPSRDGEDAGLRFSGRGAGLHKLRRASEPNGAHGRASLHAPDQCFSKKIENHVAATALHLAHYNFVRRHQTLRLSPAMAAGVSATLWDVDDLLNATIGAGA
jgi:hypothetical protein